MTQPTTSKSPNYSFTFKPVNETQKNLIHQWLDQEHIKEWFPGQAVINTLEDLDQFFQSSSIFKHWLAYDRETPFAYLLTSEVIKDPIAKDIYAKWCLEEGEAITLDLFICDPNYLDEEYAVKMIHQFLHHEFPRVTEVFIDAQAANTRAVDIYKKAGFEVFDEFNAAWHPVPYYRMRLNTKKSAQTS